VRSEQASSGGAAFADNAVAAPTMKMAAITAPSQIFEDMFVKHNGTAGQRVPGSSARQVESTIVGVRPLLD